VITLQDFPDVDEAAIGSTGRTWATAATDVDGLLTKVEGVASSGSWTTPVARPPYDAALEARQGDLRIAREVFEHVGEVLQMTSRELGTSREQYETAKFQAFFMVGDPYLVPPTSGGLEGLLDPNRPGPDPEKVAEFEKWVRRANDAADDAEAILAICASELLGVSAPLAFPEAMEYGVARPDAIGFGGVILPISPAWGAPSGALFTGGVPPPQFARGRAFEAQVLRDLGISGDRKGLFRPDGQGNYRLPRTKSGLLYRGVFPDSIRAGVLEIKSGTTEINASSPQIRVMRWVSQQLGVRFNLIVDENTPVERSLQRSIEQRGGSVLRRLPGSSAYWDEANQRVVRALGGQGARGEDLGKTPLTPEEVRGLSERAREALERLRGGGGPPPPGGAAGSGSGATSPGASGPSAPYVSYEQYESAWGKVTEPAPPPLPGQPGGPTIVPLPIPGPVPLPALPGLPPFPFPVPVFP